MGMISRVKLLRVSMGALCGAGGIDLHLSLGDNKKETAGIFVPAKFASMVYIIPRPAAAVVGGLIKNVLSGTYYTLCFVYIRHSLSHIGPLRSFHRWL